MKDFFLGVFADGLDGVVNIRIPTPVLDSNESAPRLAVYPLYKIVAVALETAGGDQNVVVACGGVTSYRAYVWFPPATQVFLSTFAPDRAGNVYRVKSSRN